MPQDPLTDPIAEPVSAALEYNVARLKQALRAGQNKDVTVRRVCCAGFSVALVFLDGMAGAAQINQHILRPLLRAQEDPQPSSARAAYLAGSVLSSASLSQCDSLDEAMRAVLDGDTVLFCEGCPQALLVETKGFAKRGVEQPINETTVSGPHEAFSENLKINQTLLRRALHSPRLVLESLSVGTGAPKSCALVYLDGVCNEQMLERARKRVAGVNMDYVSTLEELEQLLEDNPYSLFPHFVHTERPDRAVSFLIEGGALLLMDGSPLALCMPVTLLHLLHSPDVAFQRFPSGTFLRLICAIGVLLTTFLPGVYLSLVTFHSEVLPLALMTSIYETQSRVPIPIFFELLLMGVAFDLINTAGARIPGAFGQGLGVVSALVIGQAAVSADLVSPMLIIVVAVSGLGSMIIGDYGLSLSFRMLQMLFSLAAAIGGLYGISLLMLVCFCELCMQQSMGVPFFYPFAPSRMHNPDLITRYPIWQQRARMYLSNPVRILRARGPARAWDKEEKDGK